MKVGVILPSRGLIYADTLKELLRELEGKDYKLYFSHNNPIPDCFNKPLEEAVKDTSLTHYWFVEEDMVLPEGVLDELIKTKAEVVACDYPISQEPSGTVLYDTDGNAIFAGTGCLLITRKALFKHIKRPFFRADIKWAYKMTGDGITFKALKVEDTETVYGYHDITFGLKLYLSGCPIKVIDTLCYQRKLQKLGTDNTNQGTHSIVLYDKFKKLNRGLEMEIDPLNKQQLTEIYDIGLKKVINTHPDTAEKLIKEKKAYPTVVKQGQVTLDFSNNIDIIKYFL